MWDESKTTILRVTARHSGGRGVGWGRAERKGQKLGQEEPTHLPHKHFPPVPWTLPDSWTLPQRGPKSLADWEARLFAKGEVPACGYFLLLLGRKSDKGTRPEQKLRRFPPGYPVVTYLPVWP